MHVLAVGLVITAVGLSGQTPPAGNTLEPFLADTTRFSRLEIVAEFDDGVYTEGCIVPLPPRARVVGRVEPGTPAWGAVVSGLRQVRATAAVTGGLANEPWLWLRWHVAGAGYVYHATYDPPGNVAWFQTRERWPAAVPVPTESTDVGGERPTVDWPPPDAVRLGITCQVSREFREVVLAAIEPETAAVIRRRLPDDRPWLVRRWAWGMVVIGAVVLAAGAVAVRLRRRV